MYLIKKIVYWIKKLFDNEYMMAYYNTPRTYRRRNTGSPAVPGYKLIKYSNQKDKK